MANDIWPHDVMNRTMMMAEPRRGFYAKSQHAERHTCHILISVTDGQEGEK
jgi:hypothetical protein